MIHNIVFDKNVIIKKNVIVHKINTVVGILVLICMNV